MTTLRSRALRNVAFMSVVQLANYAVPLLTFPYLTRVLGVGEYGRLGYAMALIGYICLVVDWGFSLSAAGQVARATDKAQVTRLYWATVVAKIALAVAVLVPFVAAGLIVRNIAAVADLIWAASGVVVGNVIAANWCLLGLERLGPLAAATLFGRLLVVPATYALVVAPADAWIAVAIQSASGVVTGLASLVLLARMKVVGRPAVKLADVRAQIRDGLPLFLSSAAVNIYTTTNIVLLGGLHDTAEVGRFVVADRLRDAAQSLIAPVSQALYPISVRTMKHDEGRGRAVAKRLLLIQGTLTGAISLLLFAAAPWLVPLLAGAQFTAAVPLLQIMAPIPFLVGLSNVLGIHLMLPLGLDRAFSRILMGAALADLLVAGPLIATFGAAGTAATTLLAEMLVTGLMAVAILPWLRRAPRGRSA